MQHHFIHRISITIALHFTSKQFRKYLVRALQNNLSIGVRFKIRQYVLFYTRVRHKRIILGNSNSD